MKNYLKKILLIALGLLSFASIAFASTFTVPQGGSGITSVIPSGVIYSQNATKGPFATDALFVRSALTKYTDILKDFDNPVPGTITGTMTPNYPVVGGTFTGTVGTTYTLTVVGDNVVTFDYFALVGGVLNVGDTITGITTGCTSTLLSFTGTEALVNVTAGDCTGEIAISDTTSGASASVSLVTAENNAFDWTDGTTTVNGVLVTGSAQNLNNGVIIGFPQTTGYTLGDTATWTYVASVAQGGFKITSDVSGGLIPFAVPGSFIVSEDSNKNIYGLVGAGDISGLLGVPTGLITNATILGAFNPISGDSVTTKNYYYDGSQGGTASMRSETDVVNGTLNASFIAEDDSFSATGEDTVTQQSGQLQISSTASSFRVTDQVTNFDAGVFAGLTGVQTIVRPVFTGTKNWSLAMVDNVGSDNVSLSFGNTTDNDNFANFNPATGEYSVGDKNFAVGGTWLDMQDVGQLTNLWTTNFHVQSQNPTNQPLIYIDSSVGHTRLGYSAGGNSSLLAGGQNTYVGFEAGFGASGSLAQGNVAVGFRAGYAMATTADGHVLIGNNAGDSITTAQNNVLIGYGAGRDLVTGGDNVFIGSTSGSTTTTPNNVMIGAFAGGTNTTGDDLVLIGHGAGLTNGTGDGLVLIGTGADVSGAAFNDSIGLGQAVSITASNQLKFGSATHPIYEAYIGDYTNAQDGTHIKVDDNFAGITNLVDNFFAVTNAASTKTVLLTDSSNLTFNAGDILNAQNGLQIELNDLLQTVKLGDIAGTNFNTKIVLDDTTGGRNIQMSATNLVQINSDRILLNGSQQIKRTAVNDADKTISAGEYLISMENLSAPRTVTVPDASTAFAGRTYIVKDSDCLAGTHNITLDPAGTDTIDNASTLVMTVNCGSFTFTSDGGTNWEVL